MPSACCSSRGFILATQNYKENKGGEKVAGGGSSVHNSLSAASAQLHNSFPVMSSCSKQVALGLVGRVQAVAT